MYYNIFVVALITDATYQCDQNCNNSLKISLTWELFSEAPTKLQIKNVKKKLLN